MNKKELEKKILAYALDNAVSHNGEAVASSVVNHLFREGLKKEELKDVMLVVQRIVGEVNNMELDEQKKRFNELNIELKKFEQKEKELTELPNVSGNMVFRLAPYPSGDLHIGNAKTYILNALYAEKYKGRIILVIDDTIGSKEKQIAPDAYKLIPASLKWLNIKFDKKIVYKSDRLDLYYQYAEKIIELGHAYVCTCPADIMRKNKMGGKECEHRNLPIKEQKQRWKEMFHMKEGSATLRIKTDMKHENPAFRDRVLFRISERAHPMAKKKYRVWPLLEFSWAIDDVLLGITHVIRGKDLMIETEMEKYIWKIFGWKGPVIVHSGLVNIEGIKLSKSKAQHEVETGKYFGWDDPRTWGIHSLKRRGFKPEALKQFVFGIGLNQNDITVPVDVFYSINRKLIDKETDRYSFVESPQRLDISGIPKEASIPVHPEKKEKRKIKLGKHVYIAKKDYEMFKGKEIRLMHLCNIILDDKPRITSIERKELPVVNWVSNGVKTKVLMDDSTRKTGIAESDIKKLKLGSVIQFERNFFCRFDRRNKDAYEFWFTHW